MPTLAEILESACGSGVSNLSEKELLVVIAQLLADGGGGGGGSDVFVWGVPLQDEFDTDLAVGTVASFALPFTGTITALYLAGYVAPTGAAIEVNLNKGGSPISTNPVMVDAGEFDSSDPAVSYLPITDPNFTIADFFDVEVMATGTGARGFKLYVTGTRS